MNILCTADIHIGRRASRLGGRVADERRFDAARAWGDVVDLAINQEVDLLLLAGDVVDQDNRYFEAYGPLEAGLRRLAAHGIQTVAVAGNHDVDVLPRLERALDKTAFRLLGKGGVWERFTVEKDGRPLLHIDGWSFPRRHFPDNPLHHYPDYPGDDLPVLGLLHADLDSGDSQYAPVGREDFERLPVNFWLLGHIHQPHSAALGSGARFLYPGSPLALDPGEQGAHGPWLLSGDGGRLHPPAQHPLSPVRYEAFTLALTAIGDQDAFQQQITQQFTAQLQERITAADHLEWICARLTLQGRTPLSYQTRRQMCADIQDDLHLSHGGAVAFVEKIDDRTRPDIKLEELARETSPPGILAALLLELENETPGETGRRLLEELSARLQRVHNARPYAPLAAESAPDEAAAHHYLRQSGMALLEALLGQQEER